MMRGLFWIAVSMIVGCDDSPSPSLQAPSAAPSASTAAATRAPEPRPCTPACNRLEKCVAGRCEPSCPEGEVYIPATGPEGFTMGDGRPGEKDQKHTVVLTQPFCMDAHEVTARDWERCMKEKGCTSPQEGDVNSTTRDDFERLDHPINMVNHKQVTYYCKAHDQALPTEAQWEWAASGGDDRRFPWGDEEPTCQNAYADFTPGGSPKSDPAGDVGCHGGGPSQVGAHPKGATKWSAGTLFDMGGNVWEWTSDCFLPYPPGKVTDPHPVAHPYLEGGCRVWALRGGGWNRSHHGLQVRYRAGSQWTYRVGGLGFRCVRNVEHREPVASYR